MQQNTFLQDPYCIAKILKIIAIGKYDTPRESEITHKGHINIIYIPIGTEKDNVHLCSILAENVQIQANEK